MRNKKIKLNIFIILSLLFIFTFVFVLASCGPKEKKHMQKPEPKVKITKVYDVVIEIDGIKKTYKVNENTVFNEKLNLDKENYKFIGFKNEKSEFVDLKKPIKSNLNLKAVFEYIDKSYKLTYTQTEIIKTENKDVEVLENKDFQLEKPTVAEGYKFLGWKLNNEFVTDENGKSIKKLNNLKSFDLVGEFEADLEYKELSDGTIEVSATDKLKNVEILYIPSVHNDKNITKISNLTEMKNLKKIYLPSSISDFNPDVVNQIKLEEINVIENDIAVNYTSEDGVLFNSDKTVLILFPVASEKTEYQVPNTVTKIGDKAFVEVFEDTGALTHNAVERFIVTGKLTKIILPSTIKEIGSEAFFMRRLLTDIVFDNEENKNTESWIIKDSAFKGTAITNINFANVKEIQKEAFLEVTGSGHIFKNKEIQLPDTLEKIGEQAFEDTHVRKIVLHENIKEIEKKAFYQNTYLEEVVFIENKEKNLKIFSESLFEFCRFLVSINIPSSIKEYGASSFKDCTKLNIEINITKDITVGEDAFYNDTELKLIYEDQVVVDGVTYNKDMTKILKYPKNKQFFEVPESVVEIAEKCFEEDETLEFIVLNKNLKRIGAYAFAGTTNLKDIEIPNSVTQIDNGAFSRSRIEKITFEEGSKLQIISGYLFNNAKKLKTIVIPKSVIEIGDNAFNGTAIDEFIFEEGSKLQNIGKNGALSSKSKNFKAFIVPDEVENIGKRVFFTANYLEKIIFSENTKIKNIDPYAFHDAGKDNSVEDFILEINSDIFDVIFTNSLFKTAGEKTFKYNKNKLCFKVKNTLTVPENILKFLEKKEKEDDEYVYYKFKKLDFELDENIQTLKRSDLTNFELIKKLIITENSQLKEIENDAFKNLGFFTGGKIVIEVNKDVVDLLVNNISDPANAKNINKKQIILKVKKTITINDETLTKLEKIEEEDENYITYNFV